MPIAFNLKRATLAALICFAATVAGAPHLRAQADCEDDATLLSAEQDPAATPFAPGAEFTATWVLENSGSCTWTAAYRFALVRDDGVSTARAYQLRNSVPPGGSYTLAADLAAPAQAGSFAPSWRMEGTDGRYFGPSLDAEFAVEGESSGAQEAVKLPSILAFGGLGSMGDPDPCYVEGSTAGSPAIVPVWAQPEYTSIALCAFPAQTLVALELTGPESRVYSGTATIGDALEYFDEAGSHLQTAELITLGWHPDLPHGAWRLRATAGDIDVSVEIERPVAGAGSEGPWIMNWPVEPASPLLGPTCAGITSDFAYAPGEAMILSGAGFPAHVAVNVGLYAERYDQFYLVKAATAASDADGRLRVSMHAPDESSPYHVLAAHTLDDEGYGPMGMDANIYGIGPSPMGESVSAEGCFRVAAADEPPLRLAFLDESNGFVSIVVEDTMGLFDQYAYVPTEDFVPCQFGPPSWQTDDKWVYFAAACDAPSDLYRYSVDGEAEQLTATPEVAESWPSAAVDGRVVFVLGESAEKPGRSGELAVLDVDTGEVLGLGVKGIAPRWSPDGERIAYATDESGAWRVQVLDPGSRAVADVSADCPTHCRFPAWSPDGASILYSVSRGESDLTSAGIWIAPAQGGVARPWLRGNFDKPAWSNTGWVFLEGPRGVYRIRSTTPRAAPEVYIYNAFGEETRVSSPAPSR